MSTRFESAVIDQLLADRKLERLRVADRAMADQFLADARNHVTSVSALLEVGTDLNGMYSLTYDAAMKPLRAVLANQGLRARAGEGGHKAVVEAVADQLKAIDLPVDDVRWMLRHRNDGEYGNEAQAPVTLEDIKEGLAVAEELIEGVEKVIDHMWPY